MVTPSLSPAGQTLYVSGLVKNFEHVSFWMSVNLEQVRTVITRAIELKSSSQYIYSLGKGFTKIGKFAAAALIREHLRGDLETFEGQLAAASQLPNNDPNKAIAVMRAKRDIEDARLWLKVLTMHIFEALKTVSVTRARYSEYYGYVMDNNMRYLSYDAFRKDLLAALTKINSSSEEHVWARQLLISNGQ